MYQYLFFNVYFYLELLSTPLRIETETLLKQLFRDLLRKNNRERLRKTLVSREKHSLSLLNYLAKKNALFFLLISNVSLSLKVYRKKNTLEKTPFKIKIVNTTVLGKIFRQKRPFQKRKAERKRGEKTRKKKNSSTSLMINLREL